MKTKKIFIILSILLLTTLLVSADYSRSSPQLTQPGLTSANYNYGTRVELSTLQTNKNVCEKGQDFVLQIAPFGCTPSIVRSDLLEEQNVPVFCQLAATQINPLIDVQAISSMSFSGKNPQGVSGVGFHPARAAISNSRKTLLNSPVLENVGYAVIVLEKQKNESSMPDSISGTLTANIKYDIKNTFGIGKAGYYLPVLNEEEWEQKFNQYGFWNGKGYLRAERIGDNSAQISVYGQNGKTKVSTISLQEGKTSSQINIPGFYCLAGMQLKLDDLESPTTRAKLNINGEIIEVAEREKFLENKCTLREIEKKGLTQEIEINCREDDKSSTFGLKISPQIILEINGEQKTAKIGDYLFTDENNKAVYLGYVGGEKDSEKIEDIYAWFIAKPTQTSILLDSELDEVSRFDNYFKQPESGNIVLNIIGGTAKSLFGTASALSKYIGKGNEMNQLYYDGTSLLFKSSLMKYSVFGKEVKIIGFAEPADISLNDETLKNYNSAMSDYRKIINSYPNTKEGEHITDQTLDASNNLALETFGEKALFNAIQLAKDTDQKKTMKSLCIEFEEKFSESQTTIPECNDNYKNSNTEISANNVLINSLIRAITFEGIYEPSPDEFSAEIRIRSKDKTDIYTLTKDNPVYFSEDEYVELIGLEQNQAEVRINLNSQSISEAGMKLLSTSNKKLTKDVPESFNSAYTFTITDIKLEQVAKVSLFPKIDNAGTKANFTFNIGIEKRAIQLAPDEIEDRIKDLDKTIEDWQKISGQLGNTIKTFNAACLSTGILLTAKNFFDNTGGKAIARNKVMRSQGGWTDICKEKVNTGEYSSINDCLLENSDIIDQDVENYYSAIQDIKITEENKDTETRLLSESLTDEAITDPQNPTKSINTKNIKEALSYEGEDNIITLSQTRDLKAVQEALNNNPSNELKTALEIQRYKLLSEIDVNVQNQVTQKSLLDELNKNNALSGIDNIGIYKKKNSIQGVYTGGKTTEAFGEISTAENPIKKIEVIVYAGNKYILELEQISSDEYIVKEVYSTDGTKLTDVNAQEIKRTFTFKEYDKSTYQNKFKDAEIKYFETEPYRGLPAQVPFDLENGWYAAMKQTIAGGGNIQTYDASGAVSSFYLCNVGENGKAEFNSGIRDDICQGYNPGTGQIVGKFSGLTESETRSLVNDAISAINQAQRGYKSGVSSVTIGRLSIPVGNPEIGVPEMQCQDFMSPKDCNLLFNVCDPVVCPSSRCNLGGTYYSSNVIQSGIIGSIALCLPNFKEKVLVPICLTGLKAGIDNLLSVFTSYRDCLQTQLDSGETVGVCDELHSIYLCEFFWRQALPFAETIIPRIFESLTGQEGTRGGGEYLGVQSAWDNAQSSLDYTSQYYGRDITNAFKLKVTQEIGGAVCKNFISANYPAGGEILDSLVEPASPPQFTGHFNEIPFTTATVPATSQYKVFYHIYAGQESKAFYRVYLRSPSGTSLYQTNPILEVESGFVNTGQYASETKDFTAPTGYKELCIDINGQENCGFKQVSTSFAVDYLEDKYLQEQAEQTDIKSQAECVSGSPSLYSFAQPNLQEGADEAINPAIYDRGIIRVCSTNSPGQGTDTNINTADARWLKVGTCDGETGNIKCWLDRKSVENVIETTTIEDSVLNKTSTNYIDSLLSEGDYLDFEQEIEKIDKLDSTNKINYITETLIDKAFFNNQKAKLHLIRGNAYRDLVKIAYNKIKDTKIDDTTQTQTSNLNSIFQNCKGQYDGQCEVAKEIIRLAREIKSQNNINDNTVKQDTGADCFEQLILMVAMRESAVSHCKNKDQWPTDGKDFTNDLTCDTDADYILSGDDGMSIGVMQINTNEHKNVNAQDFESNVKYGINLLIENSEKGEALWQCKGEFRQYSSKWQTALRRYNGLGCSNIDLNKDGIDDAIEYVDNVLNEKSEIEKNFGDVCSTTTDTIEPIKDKGRDSFIFEFQDGKIDTNIIYNYTKEGWLAAKDVWQPAIKEKNWNSPDSYFKTNHENQELIKSLIGKSYKDGLKQLIDKVTNIDDSELVTNKVKFSSEKIFTFIQTGGERAYFRFNEATNIWEIQITEIDYTKRNLNSALINKWVKYSEINIEENTAITESLNILYHLENTDFYDGAVIIFDANEELTEDKRDFDEINAEEISPEDTYVETEIWTTEKALEKINEFLKNKDIGNVDYSDNDEVKRFIDELCLQKILTSDQCSEIEGGLFGIGEENLEYVRNLLRQKQLEENIPFTIVK